MIPVQSPVSPGEQEGSAPYWASEDGDIVLHLGKCEKVLPGLPANSVDAIVTDPPAAVSFMGREWDSDRGGRAKWVAWLAECMTEAARVLKPGGHLLVWSLPRTSHWTAWALEDAGLEIRDCVLHLFGSGFPKSLDVSKAIDKRPGVASHAEFAAHLAERREAAGLSRADVSARVVGTRTGACWNWEHHQFPEARWWPVLRELLGLDERWGLVIAEAERQKIGERTTGVGTGRGAVAVIGDSGNYDVTAPETDAAKRWAGFGTALKPGQEMWWLARKPMQGTVAANVLQYGTGALNVAACKVGIDATREGQNFRRAGKNYASNSSPVDREIFGADAAERGGYYSDAGRWPTNLVLTHSAACSGECAPDCPVGELDRQSGVRTSGKLLPHHADNGKTAGTLGAFAGASGRESYGDTGGASRFYPTFRYQAKAPTSERPRLDDGTKHETVKPLGLMSWLVRLITPPGGTVLDLFAGSGPTAEACIVEGFRCVLIEQDPKSAALIRKRLSKPIQPVMFGFDEAS